MNKIILIILFIFALVFTSKAQSLSYSKVIFLTSLDTVPQGKVWKVNSYFPSTNWIQLSYNNYNNSLSFLINGVDYKVAHFSASHVGNGGHGELITVPFPIWLPSGTTVEPGNNCGSLSIVEFTETN